MRIAVIGPLEVLAEDSAPVAVPGAEERMLLAVLAAAAPDLVGTDRLIEELWKGDPPEAARECLQVHVAHLRSALEPGHPENSSGQYVLRRGAGYVLAVGAGDIDAHRIGALAARGRAQLAAGDAAEAVRLLTAALGLWRGEPFDEWPHAAFADEERRRLADVRADASAGLAAARLQLAVRPEVGAVARKLPAPVITAAHVDRAPPVDEQDDQPHPGPGPPAQVPAPRGAPRSVDGPRQELRDEADDPAGGRSARARTGLLVGGLLVALVAALLGARLTARSGEAADRTATAAQANRLAALSATEGSLDRAFLLAAEAFRLADTPLTRDGLLTALVDHERVERAVSFRGSPRDPVLSGSGGGTLVFGIGNSVVGWSPGSPGLPRIVMDIPLEWSSWIVAAPSPDDGVVLAAGGTQEGGYWVRTVSPMDARSRVLLEGDQVGGRPVDGVVTPDGGRFRLLLAQPDAAEPGATRWQVIDIDTADGTRRDTGIAGIVPVPSEELRADFADDAGSLVLWGTSGTTAATLVDIGDGRQTPVPAQERPSVSAGFRAFPSGVAQLWGDGAVSLVDRGGSLVQVLDAHEAPVWDIAVSRDDTWAVTVGDGGEVIRWDVDPATGRWSDPQPLAGHAGGVVGVEADPAGRTVVTVSLDHTVISWDMSHDGDRADGRPADPEAWLREVCAVAGRDLDPTEWRRFLPGRSWRPTCSDLP